MSRKHKTVKSRLNALRRTGRKLAKGMKKKPFYFQGKKKRKKHIPLYIKRAQKRGHTTEQDEIRYYKQERKKAKKIRKRRNRLIPSHGEPIIIQKGEYTMSGKRRRHRRSKHHYGFEGFEGRRKRHGGRRRRRSYLGADKLSPVSMIMNGLVAVGGGVGASMAAKFIPIANPKIKSVLPIAIGLGLSMVPAVRKSATLRFAASGAIVVGMLSAIRQFMPNIPLLTGDDINGEMMFVPAPAEGRAMLGAPTSFADDITGENVEAMGVDYEGADLEGDLEGFGENE